MLTIFILTILFIVFILSMEYKGKLATHYYPYYSPHERCVYSGGYFVDGECSSVPLPGSTGDPYYNDYYFYYPYPYPYLNKKWRRGYSRRRNYYRRHGLGY